MSYITATAPLASAHVVGMNDVEVEQPFAWRGGFNTGPRGLEPNIVNLLQSELEPCTLYLAKAPDGIMSLLTSVARKEGDRTRP